MKPKPQRLTSLLQAKSLPEAYDIRCYSLPLVSKDFLKSPIGSGELPDLEILEYYLNYITAGSCASAFLFPESY